MTTHLLDANVVVALAVADHVHHATADAWLAASGDGFATSPITQGALIRVVLHAGGTVDAALEALAGLTESDRHEFWPDELPLREVRLAGVVGHRQVTDAYLAALARRRRGRLATFDRALVDLHADVAVDIGSTTG